MENDWLVEISVDEGKIMGQPIFKTEWPLEEMLSEISTENIHSEIDTGFATGNLNHK